jgi:glycosyltransferase involved in cell wall biosynthesis
VASLEARARGVRGGAATDVMFTGFLTDALRALRLAEATVSVLPSWHESFGVAVLDALGAGVPVVVTPTVALASFVARERFGIVAAPSATEFAAAVNSVIGDAEMRSVTAARAPTVVRQEFGPAAVAPALLEMYRYAADRQRLS